MNIDVTHNLNGMKISSLEELQQYVSNAKITAPKFEIDAGRVILISRLVNYNIITSIFLLVCSVILIQKNQDLVGPIVPTGLLLMMFYLLWFDYNAVNKVEINFDSDQIQVKYRSPFRLLLSFMDQHRQRSFSISSLNGFFYKETLGTPKRFRLYAERKDIPDVLLIDFSSEEQAANVADHLNNAMREATRKAQTLR